MTWDSPRRIELRRQIADAIATGQCEACKGMFEGTEAICWLIVAAEGQMTELDDESGDRMCKKCPNGEIVQMVRGYRGFAPR